MPDPPEDPFDSSPGGDPGSEDVIPIVGDSDWPEPPSRPVMIVGIAAGAVIVLGIGIGVVASGGSGSTTPTPLAQSSASAPASSASPPAGSTAPAAGCPSGDVTQHFSIGGTPIPCSNPGQYPCQAGYKYYGYFNQEFTLDGTQYQVGVTTPPLTGAHTYPVGRDIQHQAQVAIYNNETKKTYYATKGDVTATPKGKVIFKNDLITIIKPDRINGTLSCH